MKELYKVVEGILDDQEDILDSTDKTVIDNLLKTAFGSDIFKGQKHSEYDPNSKTVKSSSHFLITDAAGARGKEVRISTLHGDHAVPLKHFTEYGISFDGTLVVALSAINAGLKLSQLNMKGKGHQLILYSQRANSLREINEGKLSSFIDCPVDCFDAVVVAPSRKLVSSSALGKFPVMKVVIAKSPSHIDNWAGNSNLEIEYCNSDTLYVTGCQYYIEQSVAVKNKSFFDILKNEKNMEYNGPYTHLCKDLITANPNCKIIVNLSLSDEGDAALIWMSGNELKFKKTNPAI